MSSPMDTLLLDIDAWDLVLDSNGSIALAAPPYATAQDVASACRLFLGEAWYDTTQGVPYWQQLLGYEPTSSQIAAALTSAALTVPGVVTADVVITSTANRTISGQIQFSTMDGSITQVNF